MLSQNLENFHLLIIPTAAGAALFGVYVVISLLTIYTLLFVPDLTRSKPV